MSLNRFAHHRLDAYRVALDLFLAVERVTAADFRGHAELRDQVRRAAGAVVRNIAEAANRRSARDRAARFAVARGECGECDAALEMAGALGLAEVEDLRRLADRIGAMLTGLIRRETRRFRR